MSSPLSRTAVQSVYARETPEGVGATVRRSIGSSALRNLSPFLMLDHATIKPGSGFPDHPHRGQTTVTYVLGGLNTGDVQWMTAGRGIMHSEMPLFDLDPAKAVDAVGLQLWVDLPLDQKFIEPSYQEKKANDITTIHPEPGVEITIISGESHGATVSALGAPSSLIPPTHSLQGFVRPVGGCWYLDFKLSSPGATVFQPLPAGWTALAYIITGTLAIGSSSSHYTQFHTVVLSSNPAESGVTFTKPLDSPAGEITRFVLIAGEPLDQPVVQYGPFVVNTERQAREAIMDFRTGKNGFERAVGWESEIGKARLV
ncbi:quercetin 2,3-dioxygenase, partial [Tremellales sp. Uapishka_1]